MMNLIWKILLGLFLLDVIKRRLEPAPQPSKASTSTSKDQNPSQSSSSKFDDLPEYINTTLEEDTEEEDSEEDDSEDNNNNEDSEQSDSSSQPTKTNEDDTSTDEDDDDDKPVKSKPKPKESPKSKKKPSKKKKRSKPQVITIRYCKTTHQKYFDQFKLEMMGNYTSAEIVGEEYPLSPTKQFFSKITFFTQIGVSVLIFGATKAREYMPFIPGVVFDTIEKNKWAVMIGNYFGHSYLKSFLATSGAFEVSIDGIALWSKLAQRSLPKVADIARVLVMKGIEVN